MVVNCKIGEDIFLGHFWQWLWNLSFWWCWWWADDTDGANDYFEGPPSKPRRFRGQQREGGLTMDKHQLSSDGTFRQRFSEKEKSKQGKSSFFWQHLVLFEKNHNCFHINTSPFTNGGYRLPGKIIVVMTSWSIAIIATDHHDHHDFLQVGRKLKNWW